MPIPFDPDWCVRPGATLREMMDSSGLTGDLGIRTVARLSGLSVAQVDGILSGRQRITKAVAARLACGTSPLLISAQFWLNLERAYRAGDRVRDAPTPRQGRSDTMTPHGRPQTYSAVYP